MNPEPPVYYPPHYAHMVVGQHWVHTRLDGTTIPVPPMWVGRKAGDCCLDISSFGIPEPSRLWVRSPQGAEHMLDSGSFPDMMIMLEAAAKTKREAWIIDSHGQKHYPRPEPFQPPTKPEPAPAMSSPTPTPASSPTIRTTINIKSFDALTALLGMDATKDVAVTVGQNLVKLVVENQLRPHLQGALGEEVERARKGLKETARDIIHDTLKKELDVTGRDITSEYSVKLGDGIRSAIRDQATTAIRDHIRDRVEAAIADITPRIQGIIDRRVDTKIQEEIDRRVKEKIAALTSAFAESAAAAAAAAG